MKNRKILFLDRDGTIIIEPKDNFQVDSLEKLEFIPGVISALRRIVTFTDFRLVMVTNQDGLGTPSLPEENFWPSHNKMLKTLAGEGIHFDEVLIDRTFEHQNAPTRKPRTGLLTKYVEEGFDLANSFVIGDRLTDIELANNLKTHGIYFSDSVSDSAILSTTNWNKIASFMLSRQRFAKVKRKTNETDIEIELSLDGTGKTEIDTGLGFFNHMLDQLGRHSGCDLKIKVIGDLHVDEHHTIEDTALALGEAFLRALGDKRGLDRYGFLLPMDEARAQVALDFSGRNWLVWEVDFKRERIGDVPTEMFYHFFKSFTDTAKATLHITASGENEHHKIEVIFKAFAKAIKMAINRNEKNNFLPTTKGTL